MGQFQRVDLRHGGIDAAIKKVLHVEKQSASNYDPGTIDDFRR